jgi:hypothetical protein
VTKNPNTGLDSFVVNGEEYWPKGAEYRITQLRGKWAILVKVAEHFSIPLHSVKDGKCERFLKPLPQLIELQIELQNRLT